jgi:hypothetical protein
VCWNGENGTTANGERRTENGERQERVARASGKNAGQERGAKASGSGAWNKRFVRRCRSPSPFAVATRRSHAPLAFAPIAVLGSPFSVRRSRFASLGSPLAVVAL